MSCRNTFTAIGFFGGFFFRELWRIRQSAATDGQVLFYSDLCISAKCDCIADYKNTEVHLLKRLMFPEELIGAVYLLGNIYVVAKGSSHVLVYTGHSPYNLADTIYPENGMDAVDIAVSYAHICVYVLDDGNGRVLRISQDHRPSTLVDGLERGNLRSMSVTMEGSLVIVKKNSEIVMYGKGGSLITKRPICAPLEHISHAVAVAPNIIVMCSGPTVAKITEDEDLLDICDVPGDCKYVSMDRNGNPVVCDWARHRVIQLHSDSESLQVTDDTLLTLDRDGIEHPRHLQCVLDNGMMLVSWMKCVDVYSFREKDTRGYLACSEHDIEEQQTRERDQLEREIAQTNDAFKDLDNAYRMSKIKCDCSDLLPEPDESKRPSASSPGKFINYYAACVRLS